MKIFIDKIRTDNSPANHLENIYDFYDRSGSEIAEKIRGIVNNWFDKYPQTEKDELRVRFQSSFSAAFYELFLHELFTEQGFTLYPHPIVPETSKRPDFLAVGNGIEFYIEAKESTDKADAERAIENKINSLYDKINTTKSPNFFLRIKELIIKTKNSPRGSKVVRFLENELVKFDPDVVTEQLISKGLDGTDSIIYEDNDLKIEVSLIPKSTEIRGKEGIRPIGIYPVYSFWGGSDESIKTAIEKKATRYGKLDKPYLICINATSEKGTDDYDIMNALFGSLQVTFSTNPDNRDERTTRAHDGIFRNTKGPKFTRVSGILITNVSSTTLHVAKHWLVKHPFAANELIFDVFKLSKTVVEKKQITMIEGKSIKEILEIPDNWVTRINK